MESGTVDGVGRCWVLFHLSTMHLYNLQVGGNGSSLLYKTEFPSIDTRLGLFVL